MNWRNSTPKRSAAGAKPRRAAAGPDGSQARPDAGQLQRLGLWDASRRGKIHWPDLLQYLIRHTICKHAAVVRAPAAVGARKGARTRARSARSRVSTSVHCREVVEAQIAQSLSIQLQLLQPFHLTNSSWLIGSYHLHSKSYEATYLLCNICAGQRLGPNRAAPRQRCRPVEARG